MNSNKLKKLCIICVLAALYTAVSLALAPLSYGNIQVRVAEALTLLPIIFAPSIFALVLGCFLTNLIGAMSGMALLGFLDVLIGTVATLIAALLTYKLRNIYWFKQPILAALMPVLVNAVLIGAQLAYVLYAPEMFMEGWLISALQVGVGQFISCIVFGLPLLHALNKSNLFKNLNID